MTQGEDTPAARMLARRCFAEAVDAGIEVLCSFRGNRGARAFAKTNEHSSAAVALIGDNLPPNSNSVARRYTSRGVPQSRTATIGQWADALGSLRVSAAAEPRQQLNGTETRSTV
jgi:hypothetical protein|nr:hypothetical protein [uncultured Sphingomonas sp.]